MTTCPHCGCGLETKQKRRSTEQLRRFFALIKAAFEQWPEAHDFQPVTSEHLRAWLLCKVHHCRVSIIDPEARLQSIMSGGEFAFVKRHGNKIAVFSPLSISFPRMEHLKACAMFQAVEDVIEFEIGCKAEQLLKSLEAA